MVKHNKCCAGRKRHQQDFGRFAGVETTADCSIHSGGFPPGWLVETPSELAAMLVKFVAVRG